MSFKSVFRNIFSIRPVKDDSGVAALVIITVAVVAAGAAISTATLMTSRRGLEVTQSQFGNFEKIQNAIEVFAIQDTLGNSSFLLPCPADGTLAAGNAHTHTGTTCDTASGENRGIVPWLTLGLAEEDVIDTNGNYITYIVNGSSVAACSNGNAATDSLTDTNGGTSTAYALISHGQNGFGAFNSQGKYYPRTRRRTSSTIARITLATALPAIPMDSGAAHKAKQRAQPYSTMLCVPYLFLRPSPQNARSLMKTRTSL